MNWFYNSFYANFSQVKESGVYIIGAHKPRSNVNNVLKIGQPTNVGTRISSTQHSKNKYYRLIAKKYKRIRQEKTFVLLSY